MTSIRTAAVAAAAARRLTYRLSQEPHILAISRLAGGRTRLLTSKSDGEDPFGVDFQDGTDNLGAKAPPSFRRDQTTGKFTGEIESEITDDERKLLSLTHADRDKTLADRFVRSWNESEKDESGGTSRQAEVAASIRTEEMALNVLGRRAADVVNSSIDASGSGSVSGDGEYIDAAGFSAPLSREEFQTFSKYMEKEHGISDLSEDDIPVSRNSSGADATSTGGSSSDPDLDLTWLTAAARAEMDGPGAADLSDPFVDLMPSDLNPARKVNRKKAKPIPRDLLHHNNLSLLRRFVTPGGQIMNRVQSRLGAKDQRKVAKLIKRARHLGLIPHLGQWKLEDHGNIHEEDIREEREWEKELIDRGLLEER